MDGNGLPPLLVFDGKGYEYQAIMMRTLFYYQDLWDLVNKGIPENDDEAKLKEHKKRDAKALYLIQKLLNR